MKAVMMNRGVFSGIAALGTAALFLLSALPGVAKSPDGRKDGGQPQRYIILLEDAPLARHMAQQRRAELQAAGREDKGLDDFGAAWKLDVHAPAAQAYLQRLDERFAEFRANARARVGRDIPPVHRYRHSLNGLSAHLSEAEAKQLSKLPGVISVERDRVHRLHTDAGPPWIGADEIWNGAGFIPEGAGEGVVVGVIDSGINWEHASFDDPGEGSPIPGGPYDHENPFPAQLGLCSEASVDCNDKLVGVYDFVEDDPGTDEEEENNMGRDNSGHGSHVASIAVGNPQTVSFGGNPINISGVAFNANLVSYRVCYIGDPDDPDDDGCQGSAILAAIDQAVADGVDVINYSIGSGAFSPWTPGSSAAAFLNAYEAGIFVATSAGNQGPAFGSIGSPANAPWITAVGSATHDRLFASILKTTSGGNTPPPGDLIGTSFTTQGVSLTKIVHAKDFGNALCGTGTAELEPTCEDNTGASNPFPPGTFNGEIVVCDRGTYGRIEKGKNVLLAGAGGYVLANTAAQGEDVTADSHCLPSTHLGQEDGDALRAWLDGGSGHQGSITGFTILNDADVADRLSDFSSRGPNLPPVQDILKPDLIAPGDLIVGASDEVNRFRVLSGTSMASPHVAGGAALLKSVRPSWTPSMITSALLLTATDELAKNEFGDPADRFEAGHGRPRLGEAAMAGIFLRETADNFRNANPNEDGNPRNLNLPSLTDNNCADSCSFTRTFRSLVNTSRTWEASAVGFPEGVEVTISPQSFPLSGNGSQQVTVEVDLVGSDLIGQWVSGKIRLSAVNMPDAVLPVTVFASAGDLPLQWDIATNKDGGSEFFTLSGLSELPGATYRAGGLVRPQTTEVGLVEDPTWEDPFDGGQGVFTLLHEVPAGALWLHSETLASESEDLDLFVGLDSNGDGQAQESELVCASTSPIDLELCDIFNPTPGTWWVLVQNWEDGFETGTHEQQVTLVSGVVGTGASSNLVATGPGIVPGGSAFDVRVAWRDVSATRNTTLLGAVGIGSTQDNPNNVGVIPVYFERTGIDEPATTVLHNGIERRFALAGETTHDKVFIDVPQDVDSLTVDVRGASGSQNNNLSLELHHMDFDDAFAAAPFAADLPGSSSPVGSASGSGGQGPSVTVTGHTLAPGRWYVVVTNNASGAASVRVTARIESSGTPIGFQPGLWQPGSRPNIRQGFEYNISGGARAVLWYTYDEQFTPTWYLAAEDHQPGNVWTASIRRFINDGDSQVETRVGRLSMTVLGQKDLVFSWSLFGESGSDRMFPTTPQTCPNGSSYTGIWYPGFDGIGGASVVVDASNQAQIHYLYDDFGIPAWLLAAAENTAEEFELLQFLGFCPTCLDTGTDFDTVGVLTRSFSSETQGSWTLDYIMDPPLSGVVQRSNDVVKITDRMDCN